jgi:glutamate synthase (NADPH/NADH) small chain
MKEPPRQKPNGKKVAVIGSGPAGLSAAAELAKKGFNVVVFESENLPGGSLAYSIPAYRLPKDAVQAEIGYIEKMGVNFEVNTPIKDVRKLLKDGYDAVFIGTGLREPALLDVPGIELSGVLSGLEFLRQVNKSSIENRSAIRFFGKKITVVGGGDLAMDTAISAVKLGAKRVHLFYRRSFKEMPATPSSVQLAKDLGVMFWNLTIPKKIIGDAEGNVSKIECIETKLEGADVSGRRKPVPIVGTEFQIDVNYVIAAIGQKPEELVDYGIKTSANNIILVNEKGGTSDPAIFAGGDICSGGATVIQAMAEGVNAAKSIEEYLF